MGVGGGGGLEFVGAPADDVDFGGAVGGEGAGHGETETWERAC